MHVLWEDEVAPTKSLRWQRVEDGHSMEAVARQKAFKASWVSWAGLKGTMVTHGKRTREIPLCQADLDKLFED